MAINISRRDFLKGMAAGAVSVGAMTAIPGFAAPVTAAAEGEAASPAEVIKALDKIPQAYLNPQLDEKEFRTSDMELKTLFSPFKIGNVNLNHRMVKSAAGSATYLAGMTDEFLQYYFNLAKGGVELIFIESVDFLEVPESGEYEAENKAFLEKLVSGCAEYGAVLGYQISGFGMGENEMTVDDIHAKQARMVQVAKGLGFAFPRASCLTAAGASPSWADGETAAGPPAAGDASSVSASALTSSLSDIYSSSGLIPAILRMITKARGESPKAPSSAPCE